MSSPKYWLLKAEPDSRVVKGKDVKFSVDDFESIKTSPWEGVRNYEARNLMREMKTGENALFYHSNCKNPGIAAFAMVSREAYPDHSAWDSSHPYFDPKTEQSSPKWYMVDLTFSSRATHFVPLALLKYIADAGKNPPSEVEYIGQEGVTTIQAMDLVKRGRLSVQRVEAKAWDVINQLAQRGGWEDSPLKLKGAGKQKKAVGKTKEQAPKKTPIRRKKSEIEESAEEESEDETPKRRSSQGKRKVHPEELAGSQDTPPRRSKRVKK